jgi:hypothetical protein
MFLDFIRLAPHFRRRHIARANVLAFSSSSRLTLDQASPALAQSVRGFDRIDEPRIPSHQRNIAIKLAPLAACRNEMPDNSGTTSFSNT